MTNYYVVRPDMKLAEEVAFVEDRPGDFDEATYYQGVPLKPHALPIFKTDKATPSILTDHLLSMFGAPIYSPKVFDLLEKLGVKNIERHPVELELHETGEIVKTYNIANVLGHIECLDIENSKIRRQRRTQKINKVTKFRILEEKIKPTPHMHDKALIFRLAEYPRILLAHKSIKEAFAKAGLTGFRFVEPEKYIGI